MVIRVWPGSSRCTPPSPCQAPDFVLLNQNRRKAREYGSKPRHGGRGEGPGRGLSTDMVPAPHGVEATAFPTPPHPPQHRGHSSLCTRSPSQVLSLPGSYHHQLPPGPRSIQPPLLSSSLFLFSAFFPDLFCPQTQFQEVLHLSEPCSQLPSPRARSPALPS